MAPIAIDSPEFRDHFANQTTVPLAVAEAFAGSKWEFYTWIDIQARIGPWIVPLLFLIGSFEFSPLRYMNRIYSALHLIADPSDSISNLITRLHAQQMVHDYVQGSFIPRDAKNAVAMLLTAYLDLAAHFWPFPRGENQRELMTGFSGLIEQQCRAFEGFLGNGTPPEIRILLIKEFQAAARQLSSSRVNTSGKTLIGTINYAVNLALAFTHVVTGEFNNRTGHSIAFGMLWTWLLVAVLLSSIIGNFKDKYMAREVLESLHERVAGIISEQQATMQDSDKILADDASKSKIFAFYPIEDEAIKKAERSLEWAGMNHSATPSPFCPARQRNIFIGAAFISISVAAGAACWISATSPTSAFNCRSVQQLCFFAAWIVNRALTALFRRIFCNEKQLLWIRAKDAFFFAALAIFFLLGFVGWYNSCFCWSGWFSLRGSAKVTVDPTQIIQELARTTWPAISFAVIVFQSLFVLMLLCYYWKGAQVFRMSTEERELWRPKLSCERSMKKD